jgi:multiple sugar transport system ATP-binding protein
MRAEIKLLHQRTKTTTVYVTHDQVEAMTLGDRIAVMRDGVVQQLGTPDDIYGRPATLFVAQFIGSPAMNLIDAQASAAGLSAKGEKLLLSDADAAAVQTSNAREVVYGLRPEAISFADAGLRATISMVEPTGPETYVYVDTAVGPVVVRVPGKVTQGVGDTVHLSWGAHDVHLFDAASEARIGA